MKENSRISFIASVATLILAVPTIVGLVFGIVKKNLETIIATGIVIGLLFIIFIVLIVVAFTKKHNSLIYRWIKYKTAHKEHTLLLERNIYYEFRDREHIIHKKTFEVFGRNEFDQFTDRYVYSGEAKCKVNAILSNQKIIDEYKYLGWDFYTIKTTTKAKKGDKVTFFMGMDEIEDIDHKSLPYLSTGIYEQTKLLIMEVKFGDSIIPQNFKIKIYSDYTSRTPFETKDLVFDTKNHCLKYELKYPVHHYKYEITWEF